ncbi:MAG: cupin domain-containing protein [Chloroflexota bacterium]
MGVVHRQVVEGSETWDYRTVPVKEYASGNATVGATRRVLIGRDEGAEDFVVRYFTIPPGGHSALEHHRHQHGVVIVQGCGRVRLGDRWSEIGVGDAVYVEPDEVHQFQADDHQQLGFICVIPAWAKSAPDLRPARGE